MTIFKASDLFPEDTPEYIGYKGQWDATTNTPNISTTTPVAGDWYFIGTAGTINPQTGTTGAISYVVPDIIKYNGSSWDHIEDKSIRLSEVENSSLSQYDIYVDTTYTGDTKTGSAIHPYTDLTSAISNSVVNNTIQVKGSVIVPNSSADAFVLPHSLHFYATENTVVKYNSYHSTNGDLFYFNGTSNTQEFSFYNFKIQNSGGYGIYIKNAKKFIQYDVEYKHCGWDGTQLNTILPSASTGLLGYDSSQAALQAFYAGDHASNGGACRIQNVTSVESTSCASEECLRSFRFQDCGVNGYGFVARNRAVSNIESGFYLASSTYNATNGCENFTVYNNVSKYNANNGALVVGGINNVITLNIVAGNWNAGVMGWHVANTRFRDLDLTDNNRSAYNGIGNTGDAHSSITIGGDTSRSGRGYIVSILGCEIYNTGLGSNTSKIGFQILQDVEDVPGDYDSNLINIDNVGFHKQDYSIDSLADLGNVKLTIGDNRYIETTETNINIVSGSYYEQPFSNHITNLKECDFSVDGESVILKEGINGVRLNPYTLHDLQASLRGSEINVMLKGSDKIQFTLSVSGASIDGVALTGTDQEKVNQINAMLQHSGSATGSTPSITSSLAISMEQGSTLNYELTADFGVGYEWDLSNVSGITTVEGHIRNLIGGSGLAAGTYNIPVKAINYNGEDSETLVLTVTAAPFTNTKSIQFNNQDYLGANASLLANTLGRTGNGSGSSDAWTISFWFKGSTSTNGAQTVFYYGDYDTSNGGNLHILYSGSFDRFRFHYGSTNNNIRLQTQNNTVVANTWYHVLITYDGGQTGSSSGDINNYYSRFKIFIDGNLQTTTNTNNNYGWSSNIDPDNWRVGRFASGNYMKGGCKIDELAVWNSDQSANVSTIYNSGAPFDLLTLTAQPKHWWPVDGSTYPNIQDNGTAANCTFVMYNMTAADIVSDVP